MRRKNVAISGIIICIIYFILTIMFVATGSKSWLAAFEVITMLAGIVMVALIIILPFSQDVKMKNYQVMAIVFAAACMILTNVAHIVNLAVTEPLMKMGVNVPEYLQIGIWPSVEMAVDYLGWGLFMGLAFLFSSFGLVKEDKIKKLNITLKICGILCFSGFFGTILINENLWYIAPMGYGLGTLVVCIEMLFIDRK